MIPFDMSRLTSPLNDLPQDCDMSQSEGGRYFLRVFPSPSSWHVELLHGNRRGRLMIPSRKVEPTFIFRAEGYTDKLEDMVHVPGPVLGGQNAQSRFGAGEMRPSNSRIQYLGSCSQDTCIQISHGLPRVPHFLISKGQMSRLRVTQNGFKPCQEFGEGEMLPAKIDSRQVTVLIGADQEFGDTKTDVAGTALYHHGQT